MENKTRERGKVKSVTLKKPLALNGNVINTAIIEIDHVNYGIDKKTKNLNKKKRTNFSLADIEKFIMMLDGEYLNYSSFKGRICRFEVRIDCPVSGRFFNKQFVMVFETDYDKKDEIHTVTLFPGW